MVQSPRSYIFSQTSNYSTQRKHSIMFGSLQKITSRCTFPVTLLTAPNFLKLQLNPARPKSTLPRSYILELIFISTQRTRSLIMPGLYKKPPTIHFSNNPLTPPILTFGYFAKRPSIFLKITTKPSSSYQCSYIFHEGPRTNVYFNINKKKI